MKHYNTQEKNANSEQLCSEPIQRKPQRGAVEGRPPSVVVPKAAAFVLALNKAHVLALNTRTLLASQQGRCLGSQQGTCLNTQICPVFTANQRKPQRGGGRRPPPFVDAAECRLPSAGHEHWAYLSVETQGMCLVESEDICHVEVQDMCCLESQVNNAPPPCQP